MKNSTLIPMMVVMRMVCRAGTVVSQICGKVFLNFHLCDELLIFVHMNNLKVAEENNEFWHMSFSTFTHFRALTDQEGRDVPCLECICKVSDAAMQKPGFWGGCQQDNCQWDEVQLDADLPSMV